MKNKNSSETLQKIIQLQPSIIFADDEQRKTLYVSESFIECFVSKDFFLVEENENLIYDYLKENKTMTSIDKTEIFWLDYIFLNPNISFKMNVKIKDSTLLFYVKTKRVVHEDSGKSAVMITLIQL